MDRLTSQNTHNNLNSISELETDEADFSKAAGVSSSALLSLPIPGNPLSACLMRCSEGGDLLFTRLSDRVLMRASPSENVSSQSESGLQVLGSITRRSPPSENLIRQADSGLPGIGRVSSAELLTPAALEKSASSVSSSEKVFKLLCVFCDVNLSIVLQYLVKWTP
jgi:hypothetical protein